jgi:RNA polymerase sigma factor (sigma-70 family)
MTANSARHDAKAGKICVMTERVLAQVPEGGLTASVSPPTVIPPGGWATASDAALIAAVRSGNNGAFGTLYERHAPAAASLARHLLRRSVDVDDVVAETFARILDLLKRGAGPTEAFRPYLLAAVRRVAIDQVRGQTRQVPTDQADLPDPGEPFADPVLASLEQSLVARAFRSLPERWSAVLWHTEIEQTKTADVALMFGLTPSGVAALSYRAREGLRQAYLQFHVSSRTRAECRKVSGMLGAHVRGGLSARDNRLVDGHLRGCPDCQAAQSELTAINGSLRGLLAPAFLGAAAAAAAGHLVAPTTAAPVAAPAAAAAAKVITAKAAAAAAVRWFTHLARWQQVAVAGALATATVVPAVTVPHLISHGHRAAQAGGAVQPGSARTGSRASPRGASRSGHAGVPAPGSLGSPAARSGSPAAASPSPSPAGSSGGRASAKLHVNVSVAGLLKLGAVVTVTVHVSNQGTAATGSLTASLTLPSGVSLLGPVSGNHGWSCGGASCSHAPIGAGNRAPLAYQVLVVNLSGCGQQVVATVTSGSLTATGWSGAKVQCGHRHGRGRRPPPKHGRPLFAVLPS